MDIKDILGEGVRDEQSISLLKEKIIQVPAWRGKDGLMTEYDVMQHPVMQKALYPDIINGKEITRVTRIALAFQKLAVSRMVSLTSGIPVKRVYSPSNDKQKDIAKWMEKIFIKNRINSVNDERLEQLFAGCETMTLWYAQEKENTLYGYKSNLKFRCATYTPMRGDEIYPYFDEYGDLIALSVGYKRKVGRKTICYFDTYTDTQHIKWSNESGTWARVEDEQITIGKIPAIYMFRPTPIWEHNSNNVYEMEWGLSRNGNYIRENSKPLFYVCADEMIEYGKEKPVDKEFKAVAQFPQGATVGYATWSGAKDSLEFQINTLRNMFFTTLQLPDWSYEKMSQVAMSGESRKQLFVDAYLKVLRESGRLLEFFDREVNVVKALMKATLNESYHQDIDDLDVEIQITPFVITDEKDTIENLMTANGNLPIISHRQSIEQLGWSDDVDATMREIAEQQREDVFD